MTSRVAKVSVIAALCLALLIAGGAAFYRYKLYIPLPDYGPVTAARWLDQGWSAEDQDWYHHADQGTQTLNLPYEWFVALEQPRLTLFGDVGRLADPIYLDRFGFIPGATRGGEMQLPIGFAKGAAMIEADGGPWLGVPTAQPQHGIGFTCAACHTGRMTYRGTALLVDGGPALTNLGLFRQALGVSVLFTLIPSRFERFARNVLGEAPGEADKAILRLQLKRLWKRLDTVRKLDAKVAAGSVDEGYGRLDALNRIGNQVFGLALGQEGSARNYVATTAPVSFPHVWNTSWFDWVQYNASIRQPMVRNAGEALGVATPVDLHGEGRGLFRSNVRVDHLERIEHQIAGPQPDREHGFRGLRAPLWPADAFGPVKPDLARKGAALYDNLCKECHQAPMGGAAFWDSKHWLPPNGDAQRYLALTIKAVDAIGTDEAQAVDMSNRRVWLPAGLKPDADGRAAFGPALGALVGAVVTRWYDDQTPPTLKERRDAMNGFRPNDVRDDRIYKARPLNGVWATSPFLHNGAVPNLYALLSPVAARPARFQVGRRDFDPVCLGYQIGPVAAAPDDADRACLTPDASGGLADLFTLDTSVRGNRNAGHEFVGDGTSGAGVIGRGLDPGERLALIEFLKTDCVNGTGPRHASRGANDTSCEALAGTP